MKSERRHELQTNTLADWAGHQIEAIKPHLNLILTLILAGIAVILVWTFYLRWNASQSTAAWTDFYQAADESEPAALMEVAKEYGTEPAGVWALLLAADAHLAQGAEQTFTDRKAAETSLKQAIQAYDLVLKDLREPALRRRAMFGLAESHEALYAVTTDKKELEAARKTYQQIADQWPETVVGGSAKQKAQELASSQTQDFLVWFSKQKPVASDTGTSGGAADPVSPFDLSTLPGASELLLPDEEEPSTPEKTSPDATSPDGAERESKSEADPAPTGKPEGESKPKATGSPREGQSKSNSP
jgi:hypothetical protein